MQRIELLGWLVHVLVHQAVHVAALFQAVHVAMA
jgi:hypothetical protein